MVIYILSEYKIQALEDKQPFGNFLSEDLIDIITNKTTRIVDNINTAQSIMELNNNIHYLYSITVKLENKR
jgi:hypothetical protein